MEPTVEEPGPDPAPTEAQAEPPGPKEWSARTWVGTALGAVAVAAVAAVGVTQVASSDSAPPTAAAGNARATVAGDDRAPGSFDRRRGGGTFGTIASIDGTTLTVTDQDGDAVTVTTSDATIVTTAEEAGLSDVVVGDHVTVASADASSDSTSSIAAERITDTGDVEPKDGPGGAGGPRHRPDGDGASAGTSEGSVRGPMGEPPAGAPRGFGRLRGVVASVDGSTLTVTTTDGSTVTVTTTDSTTISLVREAALSDLAVGDEVVVRGDPGSGSDDGTVAATRISEGAPFGPPGGFAAPPGASRDAGPNGGLPSAGSSDAGRSDRAT